MACIRSHYISSSLITWLVGAQCDIYEMQILYSNFLQLLVELPAGDTLSHVICCALFFSFFFFFLVMWGGGKDWGETTRMGYELEI